MRGLDYKRHRRVTAIGVGLVFIVILAAIMGMQDSINALVGHEAPGFSLQNLDGKIVNLSEFKGKVVILDFWATWCGPCRMEIPAFIQLQKKYGKRGFTFVGVSLDRKGPAVVREYVKKTGMNYPQLMGSNDVIENYGNFNGIPTTFIIDRKGVIRNVFQGYHPEEVFEREIQKLLGEN